MTNERLFEEYKYLVYKISSYFYNVPKEDLIQAGYIGLCDAYKNYKKDANVKFSTYAFKSIYGSMYKLAIKNNPLKISRDVLVLYKKIEQTRYLLAQKLNKIPTNLDLAGYLNMSVIDIDNAIMAANEVISLDNESSEHKNYYETVSDKQSISIDDKLDIYDSINTLNKDEQNIIKARYFKDMTQQEVARKLNMTQVMVSRYEKKAVEKMRNYMTA
jgi:RNA polymerase sporulation-specific sigma factor